MAETQSAAKSNRWAPPGWPWELELFTLIFVLIALFAPFYVIARSGALHAPDDSSAIVQTFTLWDRGYGYLWMLLLLGMYFVHIVLAFLTIDFVSTPFTHIAAPSLFAAITYGRLFTFFEGSGFTPRLVHGTGREVAAWIAAVLFITYVLAKIRKRRHLARFKDIVWDISVPAHLDKTFAAELLAKFQPLFYMPRVYRACGEGILIEGWTYVMPIPFYEIVGIAPAEHGDVVGSAFYAATSLRSLLRIQLYGRPEPVFISPQHPNLFFRYCQQLLAGRSPVVEAARAARAKVVEESTTPYGEPGAEKDQQDPYFNV
ncbi:MAG: hypothetical protein JXB04_09735 [Kiritimatiellae bacterium]|nr:hypothetical protein [Kiritimatiellia bacterium]